MMSHLYSSRGGNNESSIWDVASCLGRHTSSIWDATSCLGRHTSSIWDTTSWWLNLIEYSWEYSWPVRSDGPPKFGSSKKKLNQWKSRILDPTLRNDLMNDYRPSDMIGWSIKFLSVQEKIEPMKIMNFLSLHPPDVSSETIIKILDNVFYSWSSFFTLGHHFLLLDIVVFLTPTWKPSDQ